MLKEAERIIDLLPAEEVGTCILDEEGALFRGDAASLGQALVARRLAFHAGTIRGAFPRIKLA